MTPEEYLYKYLEESPLDTEEQVENALTKIGNYLYNAFHFVESPLEHKEILGRQPPQWHGHHFRQRLVLMVLNEIRVRKGLKPKDY